ncbi:hypothetical protein FQH06_23905 [Escherichia coli]|nr:hypothetical protein [Escherichia coli]EFN4097160.1 hypothetical protein [Escherichia coli]EFN4732897.1 hypothetical protein [Escherichia coli]EFN5346700.1 hypothetical protein [Escherichia coli]EFN5854890.1 hypothetical protein [Escherichia coli]
MIRFSCRVYENVFLATDYQPSLKKTSLFFKLSRISCILSAPDTSHPYMAFTCYKDEEVHKCDVKTIKEKLHAQQFHYNIIIHGENNTAQGLSSSNSSELFFLSSLV